jgi:mannosyl-3-phosphoglycerate phosphatase
MQANWLIVTDLDGTLLDDDYPAGEAGRVLDELAATHPHTWIALASSKTPAEMLALAGCCRRLEPILIFENGSGMLWREPVLCRPGTEQLDGFELELYGTAYPEVLATLRSLRRRGHRFRGFSDMTSAEVASLTGLTTSGAELALLRSASEPLLWEGSAAELEDFEEALAAEGLQLTSGGRFLHVGSHLNKGRALAKLWRVLRFQFGIHATTVACGDAPNDLSMLERADHAIVFPDHAGGYIEPDNPNTMHARSGGPADWFEAIVSLLDHSDRRALAS